jgi:hypothetical protein
VKFVNPDSHMPAIDPNVAAILERLFLTEQTSFRELVKVSGLDVATDFRHANLSGIDLSRADLRGFNLTGANLENTNFEHAIVDHTTVFGKSILGRKPPDTVQGISHKATEIVDLSRAALRRALARSDSKSRKSGTWIAIIPQLVFERLLSWPPTLLWEGETFRMKVVQYSTTLLRVPTKSFNLPSRTDVLWRAMSELDEPQSRSDSEPTLRISGRRADAHLARVVILALPRVGFEWERLVAEARLMRGIQDAKQMSSALEVSEAKLVFAWKRLGNSVRERSFRQQVALQIKSRNLDSEMIEQGVGEPA